MEIEPDAGVLSGARPYLCLLHSRYEVSIGIRCRIRKDCALLHSSEKVYILDIDNVVSPLL